MIILIMSSKFNEEKGDHRACRGTWLQGCRLPYRFILGAGAVAKFADELIVNAADGLEGISRKNQAALLWALQQNHSHIFICYVDTHVRVNHLMNSGYEQFHYLGNFESHGPQGAYYAKGGAGFVVSRDFAKLIVNSPIDHPADDVWIGTIAIKHRVPYAHDDRYSDGIPIPEVDDGRITTHLSELAPDLSYSNRQMYDAHRQTLAMKKNPNLKLPMLTTRVADAGMLSQLAQGTRAWSGRDIARHRGQASSTTAPSTTATDSSIAELRRMPLKDLRRLAVKPTKEKANVSF